MSRQSLLMIFGLNQFATMKNIDGVSHEESLVSPPGGGNCINWVLGHITASRNASLAIVRQPAIWTEAQCAPYLRGSDGLKNCAAALPFAEVVAAFTRSQERLLAGLKDLSDADLNAALAHPEIPKNLGGLQFHETYHVGQLAILRRALGKPGAIA